MNKRNNIMKKINFVITTFFILIGTILNAQSHNEEVTVKGKYTPQIQKSERINQTPSIPKRDFSIPNYEINTEDLTYIFKAELEPISPLSYTQTQNSNIYNNFIKAGFGTRISPDLILRHYSNISKRTSLSIGLDHNSTWLDMKDYIDSKYMNNAFSMSITNRFSQFQLHSHVDYHYDMYYLRNESNPRYIHSLNANVTANNSKSSYKSLYDEFSLNYNFSGIQGGINENLLTLKAHLEHSNSWFRYGNSTQTLTADAKAEISNIDQTLFLISFNPHIDLNDDFYNLRLGFRVDAKTNSISIGGIYPDIKGNLYLFQKNIELYAGLGGSTKINTLKEILAENPFVISNLLKMGEFDYEKTHIDFQGGLKFKVSSILSSNIGVRYRKIDNHIFYVSSTVQAGAFDVILNDCNVLNLNIDLQAKINDDIKIIADFAYNKYDIINRAEEQYKDIHAWYKPKFKFNLKGLYNMNEHWEFNIASYVEGMRYALIDYKETQELKPICDIQLGCDYHLSKKLAFYGEVKNLIHNKYQIYYAYPSYGFQAFIGFKYNFL